MVHKLLAIGVFLALAVIAGCSDGADPSSEPTGIAAVDAAIDAIERQDADALLAQVRLSTFSCAVLQTDRFGVSSCSGEANNFEAFPLAECQNRYISRGIAADVLFRQNVLPTVKFAGLHAVFETAGTGFESGFFAPANATHVVVLDWASEEGKTRGGLLVGNDGIVGYAGACGRSATNFTEFWELTDGLIPPPPTPTPLPTPTALPTPPFTGISAIDAVAEAVRRRDAEALIAQIHLSPIPCDVLARQLNPVPSCDGAPTSTVFQRFPISSCEGSYKSRVDAEQFLRNQFFYAGFEVNVYAVYRTTGTGFETGSEFYYEFYGRANPRYIIVLEIRPPRSRGSLTEFGNALLLNDSGIVGFSGECISTPMDIISHRELTDAIIPPPDER